MKSSNASHMTTFFDYWRESKSSLLLPNRDSVLFGIDPFAKELPNWKWSDFGGSGKRVYHLSVDASVLWSESHTKIVWIDNGALVGNSLMSLTVNLSI